MFLVDILQGFHMGPLRNLYELGSVRVQSMVGL